MQNSLISVIVPIYNAEQYIRRCVISLLEQTYRNLEIILVNDGSTDNSEDICKQFLRKDKRVKIVSKQNGGVSSARNKGLEESCGEYVAFVDSDDELFLNAIEVLAKDADEYKADIVFGTKITYDKNNNVISSYDDGKIEFFEGTENLKNALNGSAQTNSVCAKLFKKEFLNGIKFETGRNINEDGYFLFCCFLKQPKVVQHNVSVYKYFSREGSNSNGKFSEKYLDMIYFCNKKKELVEKYFSEINKSAENMVVRTNILFLQILCRTADKKYNIYKKESVKTIKKYKNSFHPKTKNEKILSKLIVHNLFFVYEIIYKIKKRIIKWKAKF